MHHASAGGLTAKELLDTQRFASGAVYLRYRPKSA
jgi:hypothetical protein